MTDEKIPMGGYPVFELLSETDVQKIIDAIFQLLRETGVVFDPDPRVLDRFSDAGCDISSDHTVRFETDLVKECLDTVAKSARIWNRDGTDYMEIAEGATLFISGMTCIKVFDLETGEPRESTAEDLATITRVADALPNIDGVCVAVKDVPNSTLHGEIGEFVAMAENTSKPLEYLCEKSAAFDAVIEMAAAIRGGMDQLAAKPLLHPYHHAASDPLLEDPHRSDHSRRGVRRSGEPRARFRPAARRRRIRFPAAWRSASQRTSRGSCCRSWSGRARSAWAARRTTSWNPPAGASGTRSRTCWPTSRRVRS